MKQFAISLVLVAMLATQALAMEFSAGGPGAFNSSAPAAACAPLTCTSGDVCQCLTMNGKFTDGLLAGKNYSYVMSLDISTPSRAYPQGNNSACFMGTGVAAVTMNPLSTLVFSSSGLACNYATGTTLLTSGAIDITGTGGLANAKGSGVMGWSGKGVAGQIYFRGSGSNL